MIVYMDGIRDDTDALQAWLDGKKVFKQDGSEFDGIDYFKCLITKPIVLSGHGSGVIGNKLFRGIVEK